MNDILMTNGWKVQQYDQYLRVEVVGSPGYITIKHDDEGFVIDVWGQNSENCVSVDPIASTWAFYDELENWV